MGSPQGEVRDIVSALEANGWEVREARGGHKFARPPSLAKLKELGLGDPAKPWLVTPTDRARQIVLASSPSARNWRKHAARDIKRGGLDLDVYTGHRKKTITRPPTAVPDDDPDATPQETTTVTVLTETPDITTPAMVRGAERPGEIRRPAPMPQFNGRPTDKAWEVETVADGKKHFECTVPGCQSLGGISDSLIMIFKHRKQEHPELEYNGVLKPKAAPTPGGGAAPRPVPGPLRVVRTEPGRIPSGRSAGTPTDKWVAEVMSDGTRRYRCKAAADCDRVAEVESSIAGHITWHSAKRDATRAEKAAKRAQRAGRASTVPSSVRVALTPTTYTATAAAAGLARHAAEVQALAAAKATAPAAPAPLPATKTDTVEAPRALVTTPGPVLGAVATPAAMLAEAVRLIGEATKKLAEQADNTAEVENLRRQLADAQEDYRKERAVRADRDAQLEKIRSAFQA